jgi:hypothetical protein
MERCWPARHAAIEGDQGGIARLRLDRRGITVVFDRAGTPAEDEATVTVDEHEDAAGIELYADAFQRVAPVVSREPLGFGSGAPSRPGKTWKNPLYFLIDKEVTVASWVVWIASSARAHQGPATIHATARMARPRTERSDRISNLRMRSLLVLRPRCLTG